MIQKTNACCGTVLVREIERSQPMKSSTKPEGCFGLMNAFMIHLPRNALNMNHLKDVSNSTEGVDEVAAVATWWGWINNHPSLFTDFPQDS